MSDNDKLLWVQSAAVVSEATALDPRLAEILRSQKFQDWKPSTEQSAPLTRPRRPSRKSETSAGATVAEPVTGKHGATIERHYSASELARAWGFSSETIRQMFRNEPGVLRHGTTNSTRHQRAYLTLRIPESVAARVHARLSAIPTSQ
jgi:AraC-like DNA-binding protein